MPSSRCNHIPIVLGIVRELAPRSILDVGVGFGKWGHLFREYTDIAAAETDPARYQRENWQVRLDGIEGYAPYITPMHRYLYDRLYVGDMRSKIHELGQYDLIFLGDVIEHVEKADGQALLRACLAHARLAVLITTPAHPITQGPVCNNELEVHRSFWTTDEFRALGRCVQARDDNDTLIVVLLKEGVPAPRCHAPLRRRPHRPRRLTRQVGAQMLALLRRVAQWWQSVPARLRDTVRHLGDSRARSRIATAPRARPAADIARPSHASGVGAPRLKEPPAHDTPASTARKD